MRWRAKAAYYIGLDAYEDLERLLADLREGGIRIEELGLAETDLEQVFLRIMSGRDEPDAARPAALLPEVQA